MKKQSNSAFYFIDRVLTMVTALISIKIFMIDQHTSEIPFAGKIFVMFFSIISIWAVFSTENSSDKTSDKLVRLLGIDGMINFANCCSILTVFTSTAWLFYLYTRLVETGSSVTASVVFSLILFVFNVGSALHRRKEIIEEARSWNK